MLRLCLFKIPLKKTEVVAIFTVTTQAIKAATGSPAKSLKTE